MRLIKLFVVCLLALSITMPASATEWFEVSKSDYSSTYIDETSITKGQDGLVHYFAKFEYAIPVEKPFVYTSSEASIMANCLQGTRAIRQLTYFNGQNIVHENKVPGDFVTPTEAGLDLLNYACNKASAKSTNRNMSATVAVLQRPRLFLSKFIFGGLPGAAFAYFIVWLSMRPKGKKIDKPFLRHFYGVLVTVAGGALFRLIAMATFAGRIAYEPPNEGGVAGFYMLIVPAFFAAGYIMWLKRRIVYDSGVAYFEKPTRNGSSDSPDANDHVREYVKEAAFTPINNHMENKTTSIEKNEEAIDLARYKQAAEEIETGNRDDSLWYKAFAEGGGNENATKAAYIRLRVEQLRRETVVPAAVKVISTHAAQTPLTKTLYGVLGIARNASNEQILAGYQKQTAIIEAQINQDAETKKRLWTILHAKVVLLDPVKRADYDAKI